MILGIDVGTSVTKAALISHDGTSKFHASKLSTVFHLENGKAEQDLEEVLASVAFVAREVIKQTDKPIEAIAITGQGDGLWLRDENGKSVRPVISWMDARASELITKWQKSGVVDKIYRLTGSGIFPGSHAGLLAYLAQHEPESLKKAKVAGYCLDSITQRLTGEITVDPSDASLPFLDVKNRKYVDAALELCEISEWKHLLATPAEIAKIFKLNKAGSEILGIPENTPLISGPYDLQACGFGAGATKEGQGTLVVGTTLSCQVLTKDLTISSDSEPSGMWLCTPFTDLYLRVMPSMVGTASMDWLLKIINKQSIDIEDLIKQSKPGANGVTALSTFAESGERAPYVEPLARGQFAGMSLNTTSADLVMALCESIAFAARLCFEHMGLKGELSVTGGGIKSREWAKIIANVMNRPISIPNEELVGARGVARIAWQYLNNPVDETLWESQRITINNDPELSKFYDQKFIKYKEELSVARKTWKSQ